MLAAGAVVLACTAGLIWYALRPLPPPHISHIDQLTVDGRRKIPRGTDGNSVFMNLTFPRGRVVQVPVSGGKVTDFPVDLPGGADSRIHLENVSPDGSSLLVTNQPVGKGPAVWIVDNLGRTARYLVGGTTTAWSPDGKSVIFTNPHGDIYTISVEGGEPRLLSHEQAPSSQITRPRDLSWSPDGNRIRFTRYSGRIFEGALI